MVTIEQFQKIQHIIATHDKASAEILSVGILYNMSEDDVRKLPIDKWRKLKGALTIDTEPGALPQVFEIGGITYHVDTLFKLAGQFVDFSELQKDTVNNLHLILALFAIPKGEHYMENFTARAEVFRTKADYKIAQAVAFFFSRLIQELSQSAKIYLQDKGADGTKRSGAGKTRSTRFPMGSVISGTTFSKWIARNF